jgi:hypothetical protein
MAQSIVNSALGFGIPKIGILIILCLLWNSEIPVEPRHLQANEYFAGAGAITTSLRSHGLWTSSHDIKFHRSMNFIETPGFVCIAQSF